MEKNEARRWGGEPLGKVLEPILEELHDTLWEFHANYPGVQEKFSDACLAYAAKIFMSVLLDRMWDMQEKENMKQKDREKMAKYFGAKIKDLVFQACNYDLHKFYKDK